MIRSKRDLRSVVYTTEIEARPCIDEGMELHELSISQTTYDVSKKRYSPRKIIYVVLTKEERAKLVEELQRDLK